jgi:hypothetical protein
MQEQRNVLRLILRFSDDMVCVRRCSNVLCCQYSDFLVSGANTTKASLTTFNLCQLLDEPFTTGAGVSGLGRPMFQFALIAD